MADDYIEGLRFEPFASFTHHLLVSDKLARVGGTLAFQNPMAHVQRVLNVFQRAIVWKRVQDVTNDLLRAWHLFGSGVDLSSRDPWCCSRRASRQARVATGISLARLRAMGGPALEDPSRSGLSRGSGGP